MKHLYSAPNLASALRRSYVDHAFDMAVRFYGDELSYGELGAKAKMFAAGLLAGPLAELESLKVPLVAIAMKPSIEMIVAVAGVVEAGATYFPIDPDIPDDYFSELVEDGSPAAVIVSSGSGDGLLSYDDVMRMSDAGSGLLAVERSKTDPAYVIYTSGSTGKPKGVLVPHEAILNSSAARTVSYGFPTRVPLLHSVAFDVATGCIFWALIAGGTLVVSRDKLSDVGATLDLVRDENITHLVYLASLYAPFLERAAIDAPTSLREIMIGSERWSPVLIERHAEILPNASLYNEYGPSEACVWSSSARVYDATTGAIAEQTIGKAVLNTAYTLSDPDTGLQTSGDIGELCISGVQIATGYLNREELTADRFFTIPSGERSYRTGDLARVTESGDYVFLGRIDRQLKVQGNRIEADHIETVLMSHPDVEQSHVIVRDDSGMGSVLIAFLVMRTDRYVTDTDFTQVKSFVAERVPSYMVPSVCIAISEFPRTISGKIDDRLLKTSFVAADKVFVHAAGDLEYELVESIGEIVGQHDISVTDPLAELGANSLTFVRISAMIVRVHGVDIPISELFKLETVRAIASAIAQASPTDRPLLVRSNLTGDVAPLSPQQNQIWFLHQLHPDSLAYNTQFTLNIEGELEVAILEETLSSIVERHEILRTTFHERADGPVQVIHPPWKVEIRLLDLSHLSFDQQQDVMAADKKTSIATHFDVASLPLVNWHLYKMATDSWVLLQVEHHFAHDGWSASLFLREIRDIYDAKVGGREDERPPLPVQYKDYAYWHRDWRESQDFRDQRQYWKSKLEDCPTSGVTFEPDRPRPLIQQFNGAILRTNISAELIDRVDELCAREKVTRFALFVAAFGLLIERRTSQNDFVIGTALSNRRQFETAEMLGMFVNALPLRMSIDENDRVEDLVRQTMQTLLEAQDHQEFPLVEIIKDLNLPRDQSQNPLFQLMFAFHDSPRPRIALDHLKAELWIEHNGSAKNDLNVVCVPNPPQEDSSRTHDGVNVLWEYNSDLFDVETSERLLSNFTHVLTNVVDEWGSTISDLELLTSSERGLIEQAGQGGHVASERTLLHQGFEDSLRKHPNSVAVRQGGHSYSYQELDRLARSIEGQLVDLGARPDIVIGAACERSIELIASWIAILRLGASYLTIDLDQPPARLQLVVEDAGVEFILARDAQRPLAADLDVQLVAVDRLSKLSRKNTEKGQRATADSPAYLTYTSGSSGKPKAVVTSHLNAVAALQARSEYFASPAVRTMVSLPIVFDVAGSMVFWTLECGGVVVFPQADEERDPDKICTLIEQERITHANFVASFYRSFLELVPESVKSDLQVVAIGGEPCGQDIVSRHAKRLPGASLHNEYGPTEATVWASAKCVYSPMDVLDAERITVGRPLANYTFEIVDTRGRSSSVGERGELCIGGSGIALGYYRRDELTASRFVIRGSGPFAGSRVYLTGDQARLLPNGEFELVGRLDSQVKVRGYRIEIGELEDCLRSHPQVEEAAVLVDRSKESGQLVAYVCSKEHTSVSRDELRLLVTNTLPAFMVPSEYVLMEEFPRTVNGKIDRQALASVRSAPQIGVTTSSELTQLQYQMCELWESVLGHTSFGIDDDFFNVGGDSLQSIRLCAAARALGFDMSVSSVLQARTVRQLARHIEIVRPIGDGQKRRPAGTRLELTGIQLWFFAQQFPSRDHFNQARVYEVDASIPDSIIETACNWVLNRHDVFRTKFEQTDKRFATLMDFPTGGLTTSNLSRGIGESVDHAIESAVNTLQQSLSIDGQDLYRHVLISDLKAKRRWLCVVMHHLIVDVVSWDIMLTELEASCELLLAGGVLDIEPAPEVVDGHRVTLSDAEVRHWQGLFNGETPRLRQIGSDRSPYGEVSRVQRRLSKHASSYVVTDLPRFHSITTQAALLAALSEALTELSESSDLYIFLESHGRHDIERAESVVGWLTNLFPVLLKGHCKDLVKRAGLFDDQLKSIPRDGRGFLEMFYSDERSVESIVSSLPQVTFNYLGSGKGVVGKNRAFRQTSFSTGDPIASDNVLPTPLDVTIKASEGSLIVDVVYDSVLSGAVVDRVVDRFVEILEQESRLPVLSTNADSLTKRAFFVHPIGGGVDWYRDIAARSPEWICHALVQDDLPVDDITELASIYVDRMVQKQPSGPYVLVGWSFGAAVAFEMARHLEGRQRQVDSLTLLDPPFLFQREPASQVFAGHLLSLSPHLKHDEVFALVEQTNGFDRSARTKEFMELLCRSEPFSDDQTLEPVFARLGKIVGNYVALERWAPRGQLQCLLQVYRSQDDRAKHDDDFAEWRACSSGDFEMYSVPGNHVTMLQHFDLQPKTKD